jgi:hypothetical protein
MMRRRTLMTLPLACAGAAFAQPTALPAEVNNALPNAYAAGSGRMRFFGLNIYDARLWVTPGFRADNYAQHPLALELNYLRSLSGKSIAERSLQEMRRAGPITPAQASRWLDAMQNAFPDVSATDRITGLHAPTEGARFWLNGRPSATIADVEFSRLFFGIWLADTTSEPALRTALLAGVRR